jgi:hypothetical protein
MEKAIRSMLWDSLKEWAKSRNISLPNLKFPMPKIIQLDHLSTPEIMTLPTYDLDEAVIADTIKDIESNLGRRRNVSRTEEKNFLFSLKETS